jgi:FUN14 family
MQFSAFRALLKHAGHSGSGAGATAGHASWAHAAAGSAGAGRLNNVPSTASASARPSAGNISAEVLSVPRGLPMLASRHDPRQLLFRDERQIGGVLWGQLSAAPPASVGCVMPLGEVGASMHLGSQAMIANTSSGSSSAIAPSSNPIGGLLRSANGGKQKHRRTGKNRFPRHFRLGGYGMGLCGAFLVEAFGNSNTVSCLGADGGNSASGDDPFGRDFPSGANSSGSLSSTLFALFRAGAEASTAGGGGGGGGFAAASRAGSAASYASSNNNSGDDANNSRTPARDNNQHPRPIPPPASPAARAAEAASLGLDRVFHDNKELCTQVTLGGVAGFCSGYAVKKVSKVAAFVVGVGFIGVQVARYYGVINEVSNKA